MTDEKKTIEICVRGTPVSKTSPSRVYQAEVKPNATYSGMDLYERLSAFLELTIGSGFRARQLVDGIEGFIQHELEQGNRLDFGLVSFYPRLSGALSTRDADPAAEGLFVRGAVKARKTLSDAPVKHLVAVNPTAGKTIRITGVMDAAFQQDDVIGMEHELVVSWKGVTIDAAHEDEGVWLERPPKNSRQTRKVVARAEILSSNEYECHCVFHDAVPSGNYQIVARTRAGGNTDFKLRSARHGVKVVDAES